MARDGSKITVVSGPQAGATYWLTKRLTRVGSAAACDFQLAGQAIAPHALSIEKSDDVIQLHNRSEQSVWIESDAVLTGQVRVWQHDTIVRIGSNIELHLDCFADREEIVAPRDVEPLIEDERSLEEGVEGVEGTARRKTAESAPHGAGKTSGSSNLFPLLFVAGCIGLIGYLIYFKLTEGTRATTGEAKGLTWSEVWKALPADADSTSRGSRSMADSALRSRFQILYRFQAFGESPRFLRAKRDALAEIDRGLKTLPPQAKEQESDRARREQLVSLREFVQAQEPGEP